MHDYHHMTAMRLNIRNSYRGYHSHVYHLFTILLLHQLP